ncbi:MAG: hypothetical protein AABY26_04515, partial [Nanoarchaeota archaeon]
MIISDGEETAIVLSPNDDAMSLSKVVGKTSQPATPSYELKINKGKVQFGSLMTLQPVAEQKITYENEYGLPLAITLKDGNFYLSNGVPYAGTKVVASTGTKYSLDANGKGKILTKSVPISHENLKSAEPVYLIVGADDNLNNLVSLNAKGVPTGNNFVDSNGDKLYVGPDGAVIPEQVMLAMKKTLGTEVMKTITAVGADDTEAFKEKLFVALEQEGEFKPTSEGWVYEPFEGDIAYSLEEQVPNADNVEPVVSELSSKANKKTLVAIEIPKSEVAKKDFDLKKWQAAENDNAAEPKAGLEKEAAETATKLFKAGVDDYWGTDEEAIFATLADKSPEEIELIKAKYKEITKGNDLDADMKNEFEDEEDYAKYLSLTEIIVAKQEKKNKGLEQDAAEVDTLVAKVDLETAGFSVASSVDTTTMKDYGTYEGEGCKGCKVYVDKNGNYVVKKIIGGETSYYTVPDYSLSKWGGKEKSVKGWGGDNVVYVEDGKVKLDCGTFCTDSEVTINPETGNFEIDGKEIDAQDVYALGNNDAIKALKEEKKNVEQQIVAAKGEAAKEMLASKTIPSPASQPRSEEGATEIGQAGMDNSLALRELGNALYSNPKLGKHLAQNGIDVNKLIGGDEGEIAKLKTFIGAEDDEEKTFTPTDLAQFLDAQKSITPFLSESGTLYAESSSGKPVMKVNGEYYFVKSDGTIDVDGEKLSAPDLVTTVGDQNIKTSAQTFEQLQTAQLITDLDSGAKGGQYYEDNPAVVDDLYKKGLLTKEQYAEINGDGAFNVQGTLADAQEIVKKKQALALGQEWDLLTSSEKELFGGQEQFKSAKAVFGSAELGGSILAEGQTNIQNQKDLAVSNLADNRALTQEAVNSLKQKAAVETDPSAKQSYLDAAKTAEEQVKKYDEAIAAVEQGKYKDAAALDQQAEALGTEA